jgi:predicted kinase
VATLHFIYGRPGAGKTRYGRALAAAAPALFLCEDEWLAGLGGTITSVADYVAASRRVRAMLAPMMTRVLELGTSVVIDFAANTAADRAWVRSIFQAAGADHTLHVLDVPVDECRRRLHERNEQQPAGLYFGAVSDALFDAILPYIVPPAPEDAFQVELVPG